MYNTLQPSIEIEIQGELIVSNPLSNESVDIKDSKTYRDWKSNEFNHYLQVVQYNNVFNTDDWRMNKICSYSDSHHINTLLDELFHNEPTDQIEPNKFSKDHWVKQRHTWRTCNHSFYVYDYWLNVTTNTLVETFGDSFKPTLTGYFLRGGY